MKNNRILFVFRLKICKFAYCLILGSVKKKRAMKVKYVLAVFCGLFLFETFLPAQTEELRFKLYLESLSNGKKDTLELGVGPNGLAGCVYDSALGLVYAEPFFDTVEHIGAFVVPELDYDAAYSMCAMDWQPLGVRCSMYSKKRIGRSSVELPVVFPASAQPVKVSWECRRMGNYGGNVPVLVKLGPRVRGDFFGKLRPEMLHLDMRKDSSCVIAYQEEPMSSIDSTLSYIYIEDSLGAYHIYHFFSVIFENQTASAEMSEESGGLSLFPNPAREKFFWKSEIPIRRWQVFSQSGRMMAEGDGQKQEIDCNRWADGIYYWRGVAMDDRTFVVKFMKL